MNETKDGVRGEALLLLCVLNMEYRAEFLCVRLRQRQNEEFSLFLFLWCDAWYEEKKSEVWSDRGIKTHYSEFNNQSRILFMSLDFIYPSDSICYGTKLLFRVYVFISLDVSLYNIFLLSLITLAFRCQHRPRLSLTSALITGVSPFHRIICLWLTVNTNQWARSSRGGSFYLDQSAALVLFWPLKPHHRPPSCPWRRKAINTGSAASGGGRSY